MKLLNELKAKLDELITDESVPMQAVSYGLLPPGKTNAWNYIVFNRTKISQNGKSNKDFGEYYAVNIVHEDYIPDGYVYQVISKVLEIKGVHKSPNDIQFQYARKNNTDVIVEIATIEFVRPKKRGDVIG